MVEMTGMPSVILDDAQSGRCRMETLTSQTRRPSLMRTRGEPGWCALRSTTTVLNGSGARDGSGASTFAPMIAALAERLGSM